MMLECEVAVFIQKIGLLLKNREMMQFDVVITI